MKAKLSALLALLFLCQLSFAQTIAHNFNFEKVEREGDLPDGWFKWGTYKQRKDTVEVHSGTYSALVLGDEDGGSFGCSTYKIPAAFEGKKITLEGYMKIENVTDGFSGLLLRLDGESGSLAFDNMQSKAIAGSIDWKKYSITLDYNSATQTIYIGGILSGKGKAWFDDFSVSIDGQSIETLKPVERELSKAEQDTEFDKGSNIQFDQLNPEHVNNLFALCKTWGYMKYNHTEIAKGNINWDYELFRILPAIRQDNFKKQLHQWIKSQGTDYDTAKETAKQNEVKLVAELNWLKDKSLLSAPVSKLLLKLKAGYRTSSHYHLGFAPGVGNPIFKKENSYSNMEWTDDGVKLLALFRYWNMIEYFFPYRHLMDEDWDKVLKDFIPRMVEADDELSYKLTLLDLISKIQDTHANVWGQQKVLTSFHGKNIAPIELSFIENQPVVVRSFEQLSSDSKIKTGDVLTHINGKAVDTIVKEKIKYCPASNYPTQLRDVSRRLLRSNDDELELTLKNNKITFTERVKTVDYQKINFWSKDVPSQQVLDGDIGYIYPGTLKQGEIHEIMKSFKDKKGLIIDLRCYPSDFIVFSLGKYLMPAPTAFVKFTSGSLDFPGQFTFGKQLFVGEDNDDYYKGKVVILINETTQSQAEYTTMALRVAPNATVVGSTTAGADGNVSRIILPGGVRTTISGIGVYYPDGKETQRIGIVPDITLSPTIKMVREGRDELLERAIQLVETFKTKN